MRVYLTFRSPSLENGQWEKIVLRHPMRPRVVPPGWVWRCVERVEVEEDDGWKREDMPKWEANEKEREKAEMVTKEEQTKRVKKRISKKRGVRAYESRSDGSGTLPASLSGNIMYAHILFGRRFATRSERSSIINILTPC